MHLISARSFALAGLASGLLLASGCKRQADAVTPDQDVTTAEDNSTTESETALSGDIMTAAAPQDETQTGSPAVAGFAELVRVYGTCGTRTYVAATRTLTIDFGPTNCLCPDGRYRRGQIVVRFTGANLTRHAGAIVTRENYFVNDNQHTATRTFTDLGNGSFSVDVANGSIIYANNGGTCSWTAQRTYTRTAGYGTPQVADDVYSVSGQAAGTNRRGVGYTATITKPLIKRGDCYKYYVAGTLTLANDKGSTLVLDYDPSGTQTCDNSASVTVGAWTKLITLR
ncbi:hypothetical protein [Hymenobacter coccineus]|uniref:Lipoprotein n=1 Tax=Hymenobacter coccineus TaxID=1908235 RepID=A0A1G1SW37_9BACT|nr:hypothetical protein [Hymenobacter coccineus]OGX82847.1 hypothetical protein BEN49_13205 [Hymenobacter coccineus]